jgi:DNA helicase-2/ATP-dependent DNA helicase PcrA
MLTEINHAKDNSRVISTIIDLIAQINNLEEIYDVILQQTGYLDYLKENQSSAGLRRVENVEEFRSTLVKYATSGKSAEDFSAFIDLVDSEKSTNSVKLMTSHASKGTEFDSVFVVAVEEGMFPHYKAETEAEFEEERRLFYVSITRAKKHLYIYHTTSRMSKGKLIKVSPSPYLSELQMVSNQGVAVPKPSRNKKSCKAFKTNRLDKDEVSEGLIVYHSSFGKGVITEIREAPPNYTELVIRFHDTSRNIILEYAPLTDYKGEYSDEYKY